MDNPGYKIQPTLIERLGAPIWDNLYPARIRYADTLSVEHIRQFGMPTIGDAQLDHDMHSQPLNVVISINDMIEYFRRGVVVTLVNNVDAEVIYNLINAYLLAWHSQLEIGINIGDAPYDDLLLMDRFAAVVYPHARTYGVAGKPLGSLFANLMTASGKYVSRTSLFVDKPIEEKPVKEEHNSLSKMFARSMRETGNTSWK
jgi:hypothetical protein